MESEKECCFNCFWHKFDSKENGYMCTNPESDACGDYTERNDLCMDFERREY